MRTDSNVNGRSSQHLVSKEIFLAASFVSVHMQSANMIKELSENAPTGRVSQFCLRFSVRPPNLTMARPYACQPARKRFCWRDGKFPEFM